MILLIGGTGTLGKEIAKLAECRIYSRSEYFQWLCKQEIKADYVIGDVRDYEALKKASEGCSYVINCAALKHIDNCVTNPDEAIKTNILGAQNVIKLGLPCVQVSTDKAVRPATLYGATKMVAEQLFLKENKVVRLPNLYNSSGSVVELWAKQHSEGKPLTVTDKRCSRYFIEPSRAAGFILDNLCSPPGLYIPQCFEENIFKLARRLYPMDTIQIIGLRVNEKLREELR